MATDYFTGKFQTSEAPATRAAAVTKSDSTLLDPIPRAIYVGVSGDLVVDMLDSGSAITFTAVPAGTLLPIRVTKVKAATSASAIVAIS